MRRILPLALVTLFLLGAAGCQPAAERQAADATPVDTAAIRATFGDSLPRVFEEAVKAGDFETQANVYAEDAVFSPPMAPPVRGRDSIRAVLERTTPPGATADIQSMEIGILGPDQVYDYGVVTFSFTPEGAEEPQAVSHSYFALFERTQAGWKITREVLGLNQRPPGAP